MFSWLWKKKEEPKVNQITAEWWIHNQGTDLEFAECSVCGHELEPSCIPIELQCGKVSHYTDNCPKCGARIVNEVRAEDVK